MALTRDQKTIIARSLAVLAAEKARKKQHKQLLIGSVFFAGVLIVLFLGVVL